MLPIFIPPEVKMPTQVGSVGIVPSQVRLPNAPNTGGSRKGCTKTDGSATTRTVRRPCCVRLPGADVAFWRSDHVNTKRFWHCFKSSLPVDASFSSALFMYFQQGQSDDGRSNSPPTESWIYSLVDSCGLQSSHGPLELQKNS